MSIKFNADNYHVDSVLHPTDLSEASERAFHHALAIAIRHGAQFTLLHAVGRRSTDNWVDFPSVRSKLAEWRKAGSTSLLEETIRRSSISKREVQMRDPVAASMQYIERNAVDLLVLAIDGRGGMARLIRPPRAETLARESRLLTLFIPEGGRGFVAADTGAVTLRRIVVPVGPATDARPAMLYAVQSAALLDNPELEITLLHVDDEGDSETTEAPDLPFCRWNMVRRTGGIVEQILEVTEEIGADAIYMSTTWRKAGFGRVEGNVTERVLADASCPVAVVPVDRR